MHFRHLRIATVFTYREGPQVKTVFNQSPVIRHSSAVIREDLGEPPEKNQTCLICRGCLKWSVFIRLRNAVHGVKNARVRDNNVITPCFTATGNTVLSLKHGYFFWRFPAVFADHCG